MSEFSESYHLMAVDRETAIELIKKSGNKGYVFEEKNGWVTFLIDGPGFDINESVVRCNSGLLAHYIYAEDHGWQFQIFNKDKIVFDYKCDWSDEIIIDKDCFDLEVINELIVSQGNETSNIEEIFDIDEYDFEDPPAYQLAEKIGLVNYEWISLGSVNKFV
ncbi:hypothetical protein E6C60_3641 [Paenibacillus algicola]|uniref:Uncharacterized protein n=1 Tax=Paenibacillus algicola TaxID=2565926 RepID=A0A4P8XRC3_9BACL|nr:hypothetical protein [Paenibacillus algicola]QCT04351.1 hypothetical protein E6C60_3641 [Paenibacillus algicola]